MATTRKRPSSGFNPPDFESRNKEEDQTSSREEQIVAMLEQAPGVGDQEVHEKLSQLADSRSATPVSVTETTIPTERKEPVKLLNEVIQQPASESLNVEVKAPILPKRHPRNIPKFSRVTR